MHCRLYSGQKKNRHSWVQGWAFAIYLARILVCKQCSVLCKLISVRRIGGMMTDIILRKPSTGAILSTTDLTRTVLKFEPVLHIEKQATNDPISF